MQTEDWLKAACADADRRGLEGLKPLLESLARSTASLREFDRAIRASDAASISESTPAGDAAGRER
ncbi:MAG: hypothetical protein ABI818_00015 [Acidobacteriota bacterium]